MKLETCRAPFGGKTKRKYSYDQSIRGLVHMGRYLERSPTESAPRSQLTSGWITDDTADACAGRQLLLDPNLSRTVTLLFPKTYDSYDFLIDECISRRSRPEFLGRARVGITR
jgi:hypothetical protein